MLWPSLARRGIAFPDQEEKQKTSPPDQHRHNSLIANSTKFRHCRLHTNKVLSWILILISQHPQGIGKSKGLLLISV